MSRNISPYIVFNYTGLTLDNRLCVYFNVDCHSESRSHLFQSNKTHLNTSPATSCMQIKINAQSCEILSWASTFALSLFWSASISDTHSYLCYLQTPPSISYRHSSGFTLNLALTFLLGVRACHEARDTWLSRILLLPWRPVTRHVLLIYLAHYSYYRFTLLWQDGDEFTSKNLEQDRSNNFEFTL